MMSHPRVEDLSTYLDSKLTVKESQRVEAHLKHCDNCRHRLQSLRNVVRRVAALERRTPPPYLGNQLKRMSAVEATRPNLVEHLERGASRINAENTILPMFGVVVALIVIIYLLAGAFHRDQSSELSTGPESETPMFERSLETSPTASGSSGSTRSSVVAGRMFDLIGDTWTERGLDVDAEAIRHSAEDAQIQEWLEVHPELRELSALGRKVRLRLEGGVVEIHFDALE